MRASYTVSRRLHEFLPRKPHALNVRLQEAYRKYDELASRHVDVLRRLTKSIQDGRKARDNEAIKKAINEYDEALEVGRVLGVWRHYWSVFPCRTRRELQVRPVYRV